MAFSVDEFSISDFAIYVYTWVVLGILCQAINIFGIVTNIFNIVCFVKQGFEDSVNVSLLGLAVSDLGSLITMAWTCICFTPAVVAADLPFEPIEVTYLTAGVPHWSFTRVSACLTAMITLERCLCITAPLKIKSIITPRRSTIITVGLFLVFFCSGAPVCVVNKLDMKFSAFRNKTLIGLVSTKNRGDVEKISFAINNFLIPFGAFVIIVVCTSILSFKLQKTSQWRMRTVSNTQADRTSDRNQKAAKMVVLISIIFIVCFVPVSVIMLAAGLLPDLSINGKYVKVTILLGGLGYLMESINSSMNIFIYYHMSSKYKYVFDKLLSNRRIQAVK